jgi:hypothetical protein
MLSFSAHPATNSKLISAFFNIAISPWRYPRRLLAKRWIRLPR